VGAVAGLLWANLDAHSYHVVKEWRLLPNPYFGPADSSGQRCITLEFLVNDILMAFFFAIAGKEVWGAMLPGGHLRDPRRSAVPVLCAVGGMAGPALIYTIGCVLTGQLATLGRGWAIPCATDIAFSYILARIVFGKRHPATAFLLLLAIADDALGLIVLAIFYPVNPIHPLWLGLVVAAVAVGLIMRERGVSSFWWYILIPGGLSWLGLAFAGIHPALALLPVIPTIPHARFGQKTVRWARWHRRDSLDLFEKAWKQPVEAILGLFGLLNAGVVVSTWGEPTVLVLVALLLGKPLGIFLTGLLADRLTPLKLAEGIGFKDLFVLGCAGGTGFTVAIFMATVAFRPGPTQDAAKMGALLSIGAAGVAIAMAALLGIKKVHEHPPGHIEPAARPAKES
jgi:NhaA family Na+:H+ antiporter